MAEIREENFYIKDKWPERFSQEGFDENAKNNVKEEENFHNDVLWVHKSVFTQTLVAN